MTQEEKTKIINTFIIVASKEAMKTINTYEEIVKEAEHLKKLLIEDLECDKKTAEALRVKAEFEMLEIYNARLDDELENADE